jgi:hypothetical protein
MANKVAALQNSAQKTQYARLRLLFIALLASSLFLFGAVSLASQEGEKPCDKSPQPEKQSETANSQCKETETAQTKKKQSARRGAFVVAPLPIYSPALGTGIIPVAGYIFPIGSKDQASQPSVVGGAGVFTDNGSRGFVLGGQLYLKQDTYQIKTGYAQGNVNYNIYGPGRLSNFALPLQQTGEAFFVEGLRRIGWKFYLGPRFLTGESMLTIRRSSGSVIPIPPDLGIHTHLTSIGFHLMRDTSLNRFYPINGSYLSFTSDFFSEGLGSKYSFQTYRTTYSKYWGFAEKQVLAYNAYFCTTGGSPPFYGNCIYGTSNTLRGYIAGKYFTTHMLATQVEYRLELPKRLGLVVFGGIGGVIPGSRQRLATSQFLPAGGGGLRFLLNRKHHVNFRADIAQGRDGHTFGMGIGEAF